MLLFIGLGNWEGEMYKLDKVEFDKKKVAKKEYKELNENSTKTLTRT